MSPRAPAPIPRDRAGPVLAMLRVLREVRRSCRVAGGERPCLLDSHRRGGPLLLGEPQPIAVGHRLDGRASQLLAQADDTALQHLAHEVGSRPEGIGQRVRGDALAGAHDQRRQHDPVAGLSPFTRPSTGGRARRYPCFDCRPGEGRRQRARYRIDTARRPTEPAGAQRRYQLSTREVTATRHVRYVPPGRGTVAPLIGCGKDAPGAASPGPTGQGSGWGLTSSSLSNESSSPLASPWEASSRTSWTASARRAYGLTASVSHHVAVVGHRGQGLGGWTPVTVRRSGRGHDSHARSRSVRLDGPDKFDAAVNPGPSAGPARPRSCEGREVEPGPVTVGGHDGLYLTCQVAKGIDVLSCQAVRTSSHRLVPGGSRRP